MWEVMDPLHPGSEWARPSVISLRHLASGIVCSGTIDGGPRPIFLRVFSIICPVIRALSMASLMDRLSARIKQQAAQQGGSSSIGRLKGELITKVLTLVDGLGTLVRICLLPGQRSEIVEVQS